MFITNPDTKTVWWFQPIPTAKNQNHPKMINAMGTQQKKHHGASKPPGAEVPGVTSGKLT